ncbi:hypothetical protein DFH28DRAFT_918132, partial [Melampsora americana]
MGFYPCLCSNCRPDLAKEFLDRQHQANKQNFSDIILGTFRGNISHERCCPPPQVDEEPDFHTILTVTPKDLIRTMPIFTELVRNLITECDRLYDCANADRNFPIQRRVLFNEEKHAWPIAKNADIISQGVSLRAFLGSEAINGIFPCILKCISHCQNSYSYQVNAKVIETVAHNQKIAALKKMERLKLKSNAEAAAL